MMKAKIFNIQKFSLHDGPGIRTSIFFSGCNLRCAWCCNPECFALENHREYELDELLAEVLKDKLFFDKSRGGATLSGGEIFMQFDFIKAFCAKLRENNVHIAVETAGNVDQATFREMMALVDFIYIDLKHYDAGKHLAGTGCTNELILQNIAQLVRSPLDYCVRIPIIPGFNHSLSDAEGFARIFNALGVKNMELLPFHQMGEQKYINAGLKYVYENCKQLKNEDLTEFRRILNEFRQTVGAN